MDAIPVIRFGDGAEGDADTASALGDALRRVGFFTVEEHGISPELTSRAYAAAAAFFSLSEDTKQRYSRPKRFGQRGYTGFAVERAVGASVADLKEFYQVGRNGGSSAYGPNVWPTEVPEFRPALAELYEELEGLAVRLARACSLYLGRPAEFLPSMISNGESVLRIIHYPSVGRDVLPGAVRAAAHEDINFLTLLCGATAEGLEIQSRDGSWHAVRTTAEQIVVDSGDMLQNLTGGLFRSTTHRVANPGLRNQARLSMPFFVHPRSEIDLTPLADLANRVRSDRKFPSLSAGEFLRQRLSAIRPMETPDAS